jgi:ArsR family transcriptional regulator
MRYEVDARIIGPSRSELVCKQSRIGFDSSSGQSDELLGPAEPLAGAFAACLLKNVERFAEILPVRHAGRLSESWLDGEQWITYRLSSMNDEPICCGLPVALDLPAEAIAVAEDLARISKALAHPIRVRIVQLLLARETCLCGQIVDELPVSQATVSQHLKVLRDAGLIRGEIDGPRVCYCADRAALGRHAELLGALVGVHPNQDLGVVR